MGEDAAHGPRGEGAAHDPLARGQLLRGEKTGAPLAHGEERFTVHGGVETETEETGISVLEEAFYGDVVADELARPRKSPVEGDHRVQQAVDREAPGDEVYAQVA